MCTYLVYITYAQHHEERYIEATSVEAAVAQVRRELPRSIARWAHVFV